MLYYRLYLAFLLILAGFRVNGSPVSNDSLLLFHGGEKSGELHQLDNRDAVLRHSVVKLNERFTGTGAENTQAGDTISLNLFPDILLRARVENVHTNINGSFIIRAGIFEPGQGSFIISTTGNKSLSTILPDEGSIIYRLISLQDSREHLMLEMDKSAMDKLDACPEMIPPPPNDAERSEQKELIREVDKSGRDKNDQAAVDVMIVYTPAALEWAGINEGGIENSIALSMELAQLSADNSELGLSFRLVHTHMVDYVEGDSAKTDLRRLTAYPGFNPFGSEGAAIEGYMDEVHDLRDAYSADLVAIFPRRYDSGGMAWQLADSDGRPRFGFSLTRIQQVSWTLTHVHELGHNMGAHHHKEQKDSPGPTEWDNWPGNNWSAGWRWTGYDNRSYVSVMAYQEGEQYDDGINSQRVPYFSNPDVTHMQSPSGHVTDGNNARTIIETKHIVSAYRTRALYTLLGRVADSDGNPLKGARIEVREEGVLIYSTGDGGFSIPYLPAGTHMLRISMEGFYTLEENLEVSAGQLIERDFVLYPVQTGTISGYVAPEGREGEGLEGSMVSFSHSGRYYNALTTRDGFFTVTDIPSGLSYRLLVTYPGYEVFHDTVIWTPETEVLDDIFLSVSFREVERIYANQDEEYIEISWDTPGFAGDFRHDGDGAPFTAIGFDDAPNSVFGGVHRRHAWIRSVEWFSSSSSGSEVTLRILGLTGNGMPDKNNIIYKEEGISNLPGNPRQYTLPETVYAPEGFFVGVGAEGAFYIAADEQEFRSGTNFFTSDFERHAFTDMNNTDFRYNLFVRAYGFDFGPWLRDGSKDEGSGLVRQDFDSFKKDQPDSYNIYLDDLTTPYEEDIIANRYRFTGLPEGRYTVGVQAVYPGGLSQITTRTVFSGTPRYRLSLNADPPEAGRVFTPGEYSKGTAVRLEALPNSGYVFHRWLDEFFNEVSDSPYYNFTMPEEDTELTALFVEDPAGVEELRIFPNPAGERFTIISASEIEEVRVFGVTGNLVYSGRGSGQDYYHVAIGGIGQGLYFVHILTDGEWLSRRVQLLGSGY